MHQTRKPKLATVLENFFWEQYKISMEAFFKEDKEQKGTASWHPILDHHFMVFIFFLIEDNAEMDFMMDRLEKQVEIFVKTKLDSKSEVSNKEKLTIAHICVYLMLHYSLFDYQNPDGKIPPESSYESQSYEQGQVAKKIAHFKKHFESLVGSVKEDNTRWFHECINKLINITLKDKNLGNVIETCLLLIWRSKTAKGQSQIAYLDQQLNSLIKVLENLTPADLHHPPSFLTLLAFNVAVRDGNKMSPKLQQALLNMMETHSLWRESETCQQMQAEYCEKLTKYFCSLGFYPEAEKFYKAYVLTLHGDSKSYNPDKFKLAFDAKTSPPEKLRKIEEKLAIVKTSHQYLTEQSEKSGKQKPILVIWEELNNKIKKLQLANASPTKIKAEEQKLKQLEEQFQQLPEKQQRFERALEVYYDITCNGKIVQYYSASYNKIKNHTLKSKAEIEKSGDVYQPNAGLINKTEEEKQLGFSEDDKVFAYVSTMPIQQILPENEDRQVFVLDEANVSKYCDSFVRTEDTIAYENDAVLASHVYGKVYYCLKTLEKDGKPFTVVTTIGPIGTITYPAVPRDDQIVVGDHVKEMIALDTVQFLRQIYHQDPDSALDMVKVFCDEGVSQDMPLTDSYNHADLTELHLKQQAVPVADTTLQLPNELVQPSYTDEQIQKARELGSLVHRYESSILRKLEFKQGNNQELSFRSQYKTRMPFSQRPKLPNEGENLLTEVQVTQMLQIEKLFNAIEHKGSLDLSRIRRESQSSSMPSLSLEVFNRDLVNSHLDGKGTPLIYAIRLGNKLAIKLLVENGARLHERENHLDNNMVRAYGCDALMAAVEMGDFDTVKLLVQHGANVGSLKHHHVDPKQNENALSIALKKKYLENYHNIAQFLISKGARNVDGTVPQPLPPFKRVIFCLSAHGGKTSELKEMGNLVITPGSLKTPYTLSVAEEYHIEKELLAGGVLKPVVTKTQNSNVKANWTKYEAEEKTPDIDLSPWEKDELNEFAPRILSRTEPLWSEIDRDQTPYLERDTNAFIVVKRGDKCIPYTTQQTKDFFERYQRGEYKANLEGIPLFFCAPKIGKIKILADTKLSEVLLTIKNCIGPQIVVVATCNAAQNSAEFELDSESKVEVPVMDVVQPEQQSQLKERIFRMPPPNGLFTPNPDNQDLRLTRLGNISDAGSNAGSKPGSLAGPTKSPQGSSSGPAIVADAKQSVQNNVKLFSPAQSSAQETDPSANMDKNTLDDLGW